MRFRVLFILLIAIGAISCQQRDRYTSPADLEKEKIANAILRKVAHDLKQETGLYPIGDMGQMLRKIEVLGLSFNYYRPIDIVEGRKLLIESIDSLMNEINSETRIHPYLCRYPFTSRNVEIDIFIRSPDGRDVAPGALWIIEASGGVLRYRTDDPVTHRLVDVYKETYEEALERIKDPSLPLVHFTPPAELSQELLRDLRKGIRFVSEDGSIWQMGEDGCWIR